MNRIMQAVLLTLVLVTVSVTALAAPNWERAYQDDSRIFLDVNSVAVTPEGFIQFTEKTLLGAVTYKNRAYTLDTLLYNPQNSTWRYARTEYCDINGAVLETSNYDLQSAPWARISSTDAVIRRITELAGNRGQAAASGGQPANADKNRQYLQDDTLGKLIHDGEFYKVEGYGDYAAGIDTSVHRIRLTNLACVDPSDGQIGDIWIDTNLGKTMIIWLKSSTEGENYGTAITRHYIEVSWNGKTAFSGKMFSSKRPMAENPKLPIPDIAVFMEESSNLITVQLKYKDGSKEEFSVSAFGASGLSGFMKSSMLTGRVQLYR